MPVRKRRSGAVAGLLALAASAIFVLPASQAGAVTFDNACVNSVAASKASLVPVTMSATVSPSQVAAGGSVTLSNINQQLAIPPQVFLTGYRLIEAIKPGVNEFPVKVQTQIAATNTVQGAQATNTAEAVGATTITDPTPENRENGDEEATPGQVNVTYSNQTWTAGAGGTIDFREMTVTPLSTTTAGITLEAVVAGVIKAKFGCDPGTVVEGADPSTIALADPAPSFASVQVASNKAPNTKLKSIKIKGDKVTIKFSSNEKGSTFLCKLDKKKFAKCKSPKTYKNLKPGKHKFQVKARDKEGKFDPSPAVKKFKIKK